MHTNSNKDLKGNSIDTMNGGLSVKQTESREEEVRVRQIQSIGEPLSFNEKFAQFIHVDNGTGNSSP